MPHNSFNEYDCFRLAKPIPSEAIPLGTIGVVLMVFDDAEPAYEVEFSDGKGGNLGSRPTFTLTTDFMTPLERSGNDT
jgi:Domain of unknown function (DUF4926)